MRWYDPLLKFTSAVILSFFFWLPTKRWIQKLENEQEYASDRGTEQYGLEGHSLASGVLKIANSIHIQKQKRGALCHLTQNKPFLWKRLNTLLDDSYKKTLPYTVTRCLFAILLGMVALLIFRIC